MKLLHIFLLLSLISFPGFGKSPDVDSVSVDNPIKDTEPSNRTLKMLGLGTLVLAVVGTIAVLSVRKEKPQEDPLKKTFAKKTPAPVSKEEEKQKKTSLPHAETASALPRTLLAIPQAFPIQTLAPQRTEPPAQIPAPSPLPLPQSQPMPVLQPKAPQPPPLKHEQAVEKDVGKQELAFKTTVSVSVEKIIHIPLEQQQPDPIETMHQSKAEAPSSSQDEDGDGDGDETQQHDRTRSSISFTSDVATEVFAEYGSTKIAKEGSGALNGLKMLGLLPKQLQPALPQLQSALPEQLQPALPQLQPTLHEPKEKLAKAVTKSDHETAEWEKNWEGKTEKITTLPKIDLETIYDLEIFPDHWFSTLFDSTSHFESYLENMQFDGGVLLEPLFIKFLDFLSTRDKDFTLKIHSANKGNFDRATIRFKDETAKQMTVSQLGNLQKTFLVNFYSKIVASGISLAQIKKLVALDSLVH